MQRDNERDLVRAWQGGSLAAAEAFVRQRQAEIRSAAFLLTMDRDQARGLSEATFLRFFRSVRTMDPDTDTRVELIVHLGRSFLRKEFESRPAADSGIIAGPGPQKYGVENQRERTLAALGRLEDRERVALILGEVAGFEPGSLNRVIERANVPLAAPVETARQRLRHSLDLPQGESVRAALLEASFDGPREDLWPGIEDQVARIQREEQRRGQLMTYGVAATIVLIALFAIVALFGNDLFGGGDDETTTSIEATVEAVLEADDATPQPTAIPPTPTPTPVPLPLANLSNLLIAHDFPSAGNGQAQVRFLKYDPASNQVQPASVTPDEQPLTYFGGYFMAPDGESAVLLKADQTDDTRTFTALGLDAGTFDTRWQVDLGSFDFDPDNAYRTDVVLALTSEQMYVATLDHDTSVVTVAAHDLADGSLLRSIDVLPDIEGIQGGAHDMLTLTVAPDETHLLVFWHTVRSLNRTPDNETMVQISLPDLDVVNSGEQPFEGASGNTNWIMTSLAVDSRTLYRLENDASGRNVSLRFFDLETGARSTVEIPFASGQGGEHVWPTFFLSHDGYRLYVINAFTADVAVINLTEQRLERFFRIYTGPRFGPGADNFVFSNAMHLSMDGERLYIAARVSPAEQRSVFPEQTGVWVVDLNSWSIIDFWPVEGIVESIHDSGERGTVLVQSTIQVESSGSTPYSYRLARVGRPDGVPGLVYEPVGFPYSTEESSAWISSTSATYRAHHGRSPAIDGRRPTDLTNYSTLPRVEARGQSNVVSDINSTVTVRIFDPVGGAILREARDDVRFDPNSTITAFLTSDGQPEQLVVLNEVEAGVYRGSVSLPADGTWIIDVSIIEPDAATTVVAHAGTLEVSPTLTGSDGRRYQFRVSFDPNNPTVDEPATFRIRLTDVESGAVVPEDVRFDVEQDVLSGGRIGMLPQRLSMSLENPATLFGSRSIIAGEASYGVWEGTITFADPGICALSIRLQFAGLPIAEIYVRTIRVNEAPQASSLSPAEFWQAIAKT